MKTHHDALELPGLYHVRLASSADLTGQIEWVEHTCMLVEGFASADDGTPVYDRVMASMVVHTTADFLFERLGHDSSFEKLDPAALIGLLVRTLPSHIGAFAEVLRDFYEYLKTTGELDAQRCQYLACYFDTLLELHGAGANGLLPTRASRRATATLARRITEARMRSAERALRKANAA